MPPSFAEAVATFQAFLLREGAPPDVQWVSRENVTSHHRRIWVRLGKAGDAARLAEMRYEAGRQKRLGVSLRAVCSVDSSTAAYVWVPGDEQDASYAMQARSLKCQVPVPLVRATRVTSAVVWHFRRLVNSCRRSGNAFANEPPSRSATSA